MHFDDLIDYYSLELAAARLTSKTRQPFTVEHLLGAITEGFLHVYLEVQGRYALSVAWCSRVTLDPAELPIFAITGVDPRVHLLKFPAEHRDAIWKEWQRGPEDLEPQTSTIQVLDRPLKLVMDERFHLRGFPSEKARGQLICLPGIVVEDEEGHLWQLMQLRPNLATTTFQAADYFPFSNFPVPREELLISSADLRAFESKWGEDGQYVGSHVAELTGPSRIESSEPRLGQFGVSAYRQRLLFDHLRSVYSNLLEIPEEHKAKIRNLMLGRYKSLFTSSTFDADWKVLSRSRVICTVKGSKALRTA